jgi:hypothetical protein
MEFFFGQCGPRKRKSYMTVTVSDVMNAETRLPEGASAALLALTNLVPEANGLFPHESSRGDTTDAARDNASNIQKDLIHVCAALITAHQTAMDFHDYMKNAKKLLSQIRDAMWWKGYGLNNDGTVTGAWHYPVANWREEDKAVHQAEARIATASATEILRALDGLDTEAAIVMARMASVLQGIK